MRGLFFDQLEQDAVNGSQYYAVATELGWRAGDWPLRIGVHGIMRYLELERVMPHYNSTGALEAYDYYAVSPSENMRLTVLTD